MIHETSIGQANRSPPKHVQRTPTLAAESAVDVERARYICPSQSDGTDAPPPPPPGAQVPTTRLPTGHTLCVPHQSLPLLTHIVPEDV